MTPADDIEGTLYKFIPPDYTKSEAEFANIVAENAIAFKPLGEKLSSYTRPSASYLASLPAVGASQGKAKGRGKGKAKGMERQAVEVELSEDSEEAVVFEIYKVGCLPLTWFGGRAIDGFIRRHGVHRGSGSIIDECSCSSCCSSKGAATFR